MKYIRYSNNIITIISSSIDTSLFLIFMKLLKFKLLELLEICKLVG